MKPLTNNNSNCINCSENCSSNKLGCPNYVNKNCFTARTLNAPPSKRCQYCTSKFNQCLFFQYLVITILLVSILLIISLIIDGEILKSVIITIFVFATVYGYFFNKSTEKIIESSFSEKKAKEALEELTEKLEDKVEEQTRSLKKKNLHLEKLLKMRSEFLDVASHQLRTPVSVIKNTMEMMNEGDFDKISPEEKKSYIHNAFEKSMKLQQIISDILVTSELDTVDFTVNKKDAQEIQFEDIVEKAIADIKFEANKRQITIDWQKSKDKLPIILGYEQYLSQAIFNLLDNALKYTPSTSGTSESRDIRTKQGKIKIETKLQDDHILFIISDNGIGIPKDELKNMFKKFSRATNAKNMYTDGSGLGLFIIKEIIEGHRGKVTVESELGKGTKFTIYLPIKK